MLKNAVLAGLVFLLLYLLQKAPAYRAQLWRRIRYRGSATWPLHQAVVQQQRIKTNSRRSGKSYQAILAYSYNVGGHGYSGSYRSEKFGRESDAQRLLAKYPVNASVMVRVSPKRTSDSVLVLPE